MKAIGFAGRHMSQVVAGKLERFLPDGPTPPWALETGSFLATCEKCGACGEICPKGVIYYHAKENMVFGGTPYLDFKQGFCDYCGECVKVCPSGALSFEKGVKELGTARLSRDLCLIVSEDCSGNCIGACPESAISFDLSTSGDFPVVDAELCNGCGACIRNCNGSAIMVKKD
ncbi:MAG: 4Fe-4S binding protein [bacterium]|nr:4Fe-4S binding protein [bacterium]